jgi:hypothetical protein
MWFMQTEQDIPDTGFEAELSASEVIEEVKSEFMRRTAEERAFILIRNFFDTAKQVWNEEDEVFEKMAAEFRAWFNAPYNRRAKDRAMERLIGIMDKKMGELGIVN